MSSFTNIKNLKPWDTLIVCNFKEVTKKKRILIVRDKDKSALENKIQQYNKNDLLLHLRYSVSTFF